MDTQKIEVQFSRGAYERLENMAKKARISPGKLISVLMEAFVENDGKIFAGDWEEGGIRLLPDWPRFSSGVIKLSEKEME